MTKVSWPRAIAWLICREYRLTEAQTELVWEKLRTYPPGDILEDTRDVIRATMPDVARELFG